jgi:hypothetical protein
MVYPPPPPNQAIRPATISQKDFHSIFKLDGSNTYFRLADNEEWLWEFELYSFTVDGFSTAFDNVVYNGISM